MKLEYLHGQRITKLIHEMTPLEMAIHSYEEAARKTLDRYETLAKSHSANDRTKTETERKKELSQCLQFLELERLKLEKIADVQGQLAVYRESALTATKGYNQGKRSSHTPIECRETSPHREPGSLHASGRNS